MYSIQLKSTPRQINMESEKTPLKRKIIFQIIIFRFYVNLRGVYRAPSLLELWPRDSSSSCFQTTIDKVREKCHLQGYRCDAASLTSTFTPWSSDCSGRWNVSAAMSPSSSQGARRPASGPRLEAGQQLSATSSFSRTHASSGHTAARSSFT